jgi:DamX protein
VENSEKPDTRKTIGGIIAALDKRIGALERNAQTDAPLPSGADPIAGSAAELGDKLRDVETSLVNRIADVDDDRRRTAATLQRALESHQEAVDEELRRRGRSTVALFLLVVLLVPLAFWLGLRQAGPRADTTSELAALRGEVARLSAATAEAPLEGRLDELSETVTTLSGAIERLDGVNAAAGLAELQAEMARLSAADGAGLGDRLSELTEIVSGISEAVARLDAQRDQGMATLLERERGERQAVDTGLAERLGRLEDLQAELNGKIAGLRSSLSGAADASPGAGASAGGVTAQAPASPDRPSAAKAAEDEEATPGAAASPGEDEESPGPNQAAEAQTQAGQSGQRRPAQASDTASAALAEGLGESAPAVKDGVVIVGDQPFALQLIGFFSLEELRRFAARDDLPARVFYRRETLRGQPWYVLIHSLHEGSRAAAEEGERLSPDLAALDIWIRPLEEGSRLEVLETGAKGPGSAE